MSTKKKAADDAANENQSTGTSEKAGVGNQAHPLNIQIPESALIKRDVATETGTKTTASPEVLGNKTLMIIDITMSRPVHVSLIEALGLTPDTDGRLIFVQGPVSNDLMPLAVARAKFAVKKDGTAIYNARGFDDVPTGDFDLLDIEKLIEFHHGAGGKKVKAQADAAAKKESAAAEKESKEREKANKDAEKAAAKKE